MTDTIPVRHDGPPDGPVFLFAHGANLAMDSDWMEAVTGHLAEAGVRVARFEFPYMARRRVDGRQRPPDREPVLSNTWRHMIASHGPADRLVIGGKSMGGRIASLVADAEGVRGLACLGYPFHPSGKPERTRATHLADLRTPTLICQGTRDPMGTEASVGALALSAAIRILWLEDGDHGFRPRKASGLTESHNIAVAAGEVARFVHAMAA